MVKREILWILGIVFVFKAHFSTLAQPDTIFAPSGQRRDGLTKLLFCKGSEGLAPDVALHGSR